MRAVLDPIEFEEFSYTLPSEIGAKTGFLRGDGAVQFIQSVEKHLRDFEAESKNDVKGYIKVLKKNLKNQNFADDVLSKLVEETQTLKNQVENREKSLAQIEGQMKALREI